MKRLICTLLLVTICAMMICTAFAETAPDKAQETLAKYEKLVEGDWKLRWRYLPLDKSSFLSDKCKPANYWSYPGMTVPTWSSPSVWTGRSASSSGIPPRRRREGDNPADGNERLGCLTRAFDSDEGGCAA